MSNLYISSPVKVINDLGLTTKMRNGITNMDGRLAKDGDVVLCCTDRGTVYIVTGGRVRGRFVRINRPCSEWCKSIVRCIEKLGLCTEAQRDEHLKWVKETIEDESRRDQLDYLRDSLIKAGFKPPIKLVREADKSRRSRRKKDDIPF